MSNVMNTGADAASARPSSPSVSRYVGRSVLRLEDERLLTGRGHYVADLARPDLAHLVVVRSPHPFADIVSIDAAAARAMPGVLGVYTGADVRAEGLGGIPWELRPPVPPGTPASSLPPAGHPSVAPPQPLLADGVVRYQGEPVAVVVAATLGAAQDAADALAIEYAPRPAVIDARGAESADAPVVWPQFPGNLCFTTRYGDAAATDAAFARARHVSRFSTLVPRLVQNPIETRTYVGEWEAAGERYVLHAAAGKPQSVGRCLANDVLHVPEDRVRVISRDVGGGFGAKNTLYAEEALVLWLARKLGRPVRWIAPRSEGFLSDMQARDQALDVEVAFDADARILGVRVTQITNLGAYLGQRGVTPATLPAKMFTNVYAIPAMDLRVRAVHTNTVPTCPYRGAGAPEAVYAIERVLDLAARELGIAPAEIRKRNLVPRGAMPYRTALGALYDSGHFDANMDAAERRADVAGFAARRAASAARGRLRGIGYANMVEACGHSISEQADVACTPDGVVTVRIGSMSNGQSHETVYAQMAAEALGIDIGRIRIVQGDSDETPWGMGTGASRSMTVGGSALVVAAERLIETGRPIAADLLEAAGQDVAYTDGEYRVVGTDRKVTLERVAAKAVQSGARPDRGLESTHRYAPAESTYPNGCHIAEVEVDPETGVVRIERYTMAQDVGRALNPMVVEGQLQGGVTQGVGEALMERLVYDDASGQVLTGSFMDYGMPRADDVPAYAIDILEVACTHTPTGAKSVGEAGATAAPAAVANAVLDALAPLGVKHVELPLTREAVWRAIAGAQR